MGSPAILGSAAGGAGRNVGEFDPAASNSRRSSGAPTAASFRLMAPISMPRLTLIFVRQRGRKNDNLCCPTLSAVQIATAVLKIPAPGLCARLKPICRLQSLTCDGPIGINNLPYFPGFKERPFLDGRARWRDDSGKGLWLARSNQPANPRVDAPICAGLESGGSPVPMLRDRARRP